MLTACRDEKIPRPLSHPTFVIEDAPPMSFDLIIRFLSVCRVMKKYGAPQHRGGSRKLFFSVIHLTFDRQKLRHQVQARRRQEYPSHGGGH
jgi:hypothetical protein